MSTTEGFHCIRDTSPGPQGVHNRGVPLYLFRKSLSWLVEFKISCNSDLNFSRISSIFSLVLSPLPSQRTLRLAEGPPREEATADKDAVRAQDRCRGRGEAVSAGPVREEPGGRGSKLSTGSSEQVRSGVRTACFELPSSPFAWKLFDQVLHPLVSLQRSGTGCSDAAETVRSHPWDLWQTGQLSLFLSLSRETPSFVCIVQNT